MQIRFFRPEADYEMVSAWWKAWKWPVLPLDALPKTGVIISTQTDVCAGWLYQSDSSIAWIEFIISNPNYREPDRSLCLDTLIGTLLTLAREAGYQNVFTSTNAASLIKRHERNGFRVTDINVTHLMRTI
jgi:hypothetical protein